MNFKSLLAATALVTAGFATASTAASLSDDITMPTEIFPNISYDAAVNPLDPIPDGSKTFYIKLGEVPLELWGDVNVDVAPGGALDNFCAQWSNLAQVCTGALDDDGGTAAPNTELLVLNNDFAGGAVGDVFSLTFSWFGVQPTTIGDGTALVADAEFDGISITPAVPVPAGILLMGTAIAGFGVMRRRKKAA